MKIKLHEIPVYEVVNGYADSEENNLLYRKCFCDILIKNGREDTKNYIMAGIRAERGEEYGGQQQFERFCEE